MEIEALEGNIDVFVEPISGLLNKGENFIDLSTSLYPAFYNKKELKDAINACVKKVTKIRILLDKNANINTLKKEVSWIFDLHDKNPKKIEIAKAVNDVEHCILVDEKYFRIEAKHKHVDEEVPALKNLII